MGMPDARPKILIVDDIVDNLIAMEKLLKKLDVDVVRATSGNEALSYILYNEFALIVLDVQMPEMDGFEVAEILKTDDRTENIPIIFVTAIDREDAKEIRGYRKGAVDFIFKPLNDYIFISKVKVFLEIYTIRTDLKAMVDRQTRELRETNRELTAQIARNEKTTHDLARARSYLVNVYNSIASMLIGVDSQGTIVNMNKEAEKASVVPSAGARGISLKKAFPFYDGLTGLVMDSIQKGTPVEKNRVPVTVDETLYLKNFCIYPLIDNGNRGAVIRVDDITKQARIDDMMIQSEKMLSVGGLAAGMAHEINNPLSGIIQNVQVLRNRLSQDLPANIAASGELGFSMETLKAYMEKRQIFQLIESVLSAGNRAAQVIENMLSFSRKSESINQFESLDILMDKTIELVKNDYHLKRKFNSGQITIHRDYQTPMPQVVCQGSKIQQVLLNILTNGAHAMEEKTETGKEPNHFFIRIHADGDLACMEIEDTGAGMDEAVRKRIFEPFYTTKKTGTGLGLSIAYFIITEDHGGTMEVESIPGKGSRFIIRLPLQGAAGKTDHLASHAT